MAAENGDETSGVGDDDARSAGERRPRAKAPVTIDLAAEQVGAKGARPQTPMPPRAESKPSEPPREAAHSSAAGKRAEPGGTGGGRFGSVARSLTGDDGWQRSAIAGIIGGLAAFLLVIVLQAVGLLPAPGRSAANQALEKSQAAGDATAALDRRVTAMEAMTEGLPAMRTAMRDLDTRATRLEEASGKAVTRDDLAKVSAAVSALSKRLDDMPAAAGAADLAALQARVAKIESAGSDESQSPETAADVAALQAQMAELGKRIQSTDDKLASTLNVPSADGAAAIRAMALESLRRSAESAGPFQTAVDTVSALGAPPAKITELRAYAGGGTPSAAELAAQFPRVGDAILSATVARDPNATWWQRAMQWFSALVSVRPSGPVAGNDPPAIVSRMTADVERGALAEALAERRSLPPAGLEVSNAWAEAAAKRVAVDRLVDEIARSFDATGAG